jgi:hypothetical protein
MLLVYEIISANYMQTNRYKGHCINTLHFHHNDNGMGKYICENSTEPTVIKTCMINRGNKAEQQNRNIFILFVTELVTF